MTKSVLEQINDIDEGNRQAAHGELAFRLDEEQLAKLKVWIAEQDHKAGYYKDRSKYGAIGGAYTYSFSPTSIGTVVRVSHGGTKETIDLTDYESW